MCKANVSQLMKKILHITCIAKDELNMINFRSKLLFGYSSLFRRYSEGSNNPKDRYSEGSIVRK